MAYTIKSGDTLSEIAASNNTTVDAIAKANNITNVNEIQAGASLNIPTSSGSSGSNNSVGSSNAFVDTLNNVVQSGKDTVTDFFTNLKDSTNEKVSHIDKHNDKNVSFKDIPNLLLQSILDPDAAAEKNPYWTGSTYDKSRDVDGDGFPDYDSAGRKISADPAFAHQGTPDLANMKEGESFQIGHTTYTKNSSGTFDKMKADGSVDNGNDDATNTVSEFDQMIEEIESVEFKTAMEKYLEEKQGLVGEQLSAEMDKVLADPEGWLKTSGISVTDNLPSIDANAAGTTLDPNDPKYQLNTNETADVQTVTNTSTVDAVTAKNANTYKVNTVSDDITGKEYQVDPVTGEIEDKHLVDADDLLIDMDGSATGVNKDGSVNQVGKALNDYATQNISNIIDTSTVAGKLLAQELGEGNYIDAKSTMLGQLEIISKQFVDADGNPKIPTWGQSLARNVARNIAFTGVSGTAAMSAMSQALMESTLPIAEKESAFFQTLISTNLTNKQESIINKAKVLSNFEITNVDAKTKAAIQNAEAFLSMDLKNLEFENQAEVINTQSRVQALFEDQKAVNAQRLFTAQEQNEMDRFYDQLNSQVEMFVAGQLNEMKKFNVGEINDNAEFNANLQNNREQFLANMQFNIDKAVAEWKQNVILTEYKTKAEAAATDAKNLLDVKLEVMNQLWDESDNLLDYVITIGENEKDREIALAQLAAESGSTPSFLEQLVMTGVTAAIKWW